MKSVGGHQQVGLDRTGAGAQLDPSPSAVVFFYPAIPDKSYPGRKCGVGQRPGQGRAPDAQASG